MSVISCLLHCTEKDTTNSNVHITEFENIYTKKLDLALMWSPLAAVEAAILETLRTV